MYRKVLVEFFRPLEFNLDRLLDHSATKVKFMPFESDMGVPSDAFVEVESEILYLICQ